MDHHHLSVSRSARYATLGTPSPAIRDVWFVLHGYGQLAGYFLRHFRPLDDGTCLVVAPEALSRFYLDDSYQRVGASWMTRDDRERDIADNNAYLDAVAGPVWRDIDRDAVRIHVLGFSQGGATAARWVTVGGAPCHRLILWGARIPHELSEWANRLNELDLTYVAGTQDAYLTPARVDEERAWLSGHGVRYTYVPYEGEHRLYPDMLRKINGRSP